MRRTLVMSLSIGLILMLAVGVGVAVPRMRTVRTIGGLEFKANRFIKSEQRYDRDMIRVAQGGTVTWKEADPTGEPHTVTIIRAADVPRSAEEVFACEACGAVFPAHFPEGDEGPLVEVVNVGRPGLNRPGDSLWLNDDAEIAAKVTAKPGRTLNYVCAIHPWMLGKIEVR